MGARMDSECRGGGRGARTARSCGRPAWVATRGGAPAGTTREGRAGLETRTPGAPRLEGSGLQVLRARLAEDGVDAFDQLARAERLGDVVVRADLETHLLVGVATLRRQQDDGNRLRPVVGLERLA